MDFIRDFADWLSTGWGDRLGIFFPLIVLGLLGLYLLWLIIGYLRVSQVGLRDEAGPQQVVALPPASEGMERPRGVPYCSVDGLQYPAGARFCTQCERDLVIDCVNCGATLSGSDTSCYRCGTPTGVSAPGLLG